MADLNSLIERHYTSLAARTEDVDRELFAPDVVAIDPSGTQEGIDAFLAHQRVFQSAFPDIRAELRSSVEDGDRIAVEGTLIGTHTAPLPSPMGEIPPTNRRLELSFAQFCEVREGRITRHVTYFDQMSFLGQLGLLPEPAGAAS